LTITTVSDSETYEAWYHTPRGAWIGTAEFTLMMRLLRPLPGSGLLDVGCGTGYFSRRFADSGLQATGLDPDKAATAYAKGLGGQVRYFNGSALSLPFNDEAFDYCTAVTSLCFIYGPQQALREMWRVSRHGVCLGLLNRQSLIYLKKHNSQGYAGARWDAWADVQSWIKPLSPTPLAVKHKTAIILPSGNKLARVVERLMPASFHFGGFLAVYISKG